MRDEFEKLVSAGKIARHHVEPLVALAAQQYCLHKSWGFGRITHVDTIFGRFQIDFQGKPGHFMDLAFAAESLRPLPAEHILVRKAQDLPALRELAVHHLDLIRVVLQSYGGHATVDQIQQLLVPEVIAEDWRGWWDRAKHDMKRDGHFLVPARRSEPVVYQAQEVSLRDRLLAEVCRAKGLKARLAVCAELLRSLEELVEPGAALREAADMLSGEIESHHRTQPALALEAVFMRDDLRAAAHLPAPPESVPAAAAELDAASVWAQVDSVSRLLEAMPAPKHKRAIQSLRQARPDRWDRDLIEILNTVNAKLCGECAALLGSGDKLDLLRDTLARLISQHQASSELLLWLARERSSVFAEILGPEVFRAMLTAIERDLFNERKSNRLRDFVVDDQDLLIELIETADIEVVKDLTRALQLSPSFGDMDKRSLLARIVKHAPVVQSLISGEHARQDLSLVVSWGSLERRKAEYDELVHKRIPANSRDIAIARSYGDLSENHEFKAAKEQHRLLTRRKGELELQLARARGTDFSNPRTDVVSIGTRVQVTDRLSQRAETFAVLGAWDFDPDRHIVSYLSPVAQALLSHKVGETVEFEMDGARRSYRIDSIAPHAGPADPPAAAPPAAALTVEGTAAASPPARS